MFDQLTKYANQATETVTSAINETLSVDFGADVAETISENLTASFTETSTKVLDGVVDTNRRAVEFMVSTADRVADQVKVDLPWAEYLPTPAVAGERYLEFVERAVAVNRDMNERIVEMLKQGAEKSTQATQAAADTVTGAAKTTAAKASATTSSAKKTASKKTAAKKSTAKKSTAKKSTAKKSTARKSTAKKSTAS